MTHNLFKMNTLCVNNPAVNFTTMSKTTELLTAIIANDFSWTMRLLETEDINEYGMEIVNKSRDEIEIKPIIPIICALRYFSYDNVTEVVRKLLEKGASYTDKGYFSDHSDCVNAIEMAIDWAYLDVLKLFNCEGPEDYVDYTIKHGGHQCIVSYLHETYHWKQPEEYFVSVCNKSIDLIKFFAEKLFVPQEDELQRDKAVLKDLLSRGLFRALSVNFDSQYKWNCKKIEYLLSLCDFSGIDANYSENGKTYLHYIHNAESLNVLIAAGLDTRLPVHKGIIFELIKKPNKIDIIRRLVENDKDLVHELNDSLTPMIRCCYWLRDYGVQAYFPLMEIFYQNGADINYAEKSGHTIASICAGRDQLDQLKVIVEDWGASLIVPEGIKNPLTTAKQWNRPNTTAYLEEIYQQRGISIL